MGRKVVTPLRYPGGKSQLTNFVTMIMELNHLYDNEIHKPHINTLVEPFAGGCGLSMELLSNGYVDKLIINDFDRGVYAFWKTLFTDTEWLIDTIWKSPITIDERIKHKKIYNDRHTADIRSLAFAVLFLNRVNRSGILSGGVIGGNDQSGKYKMDCRFNRESIIGKITNLAKYKDSVDVYNMTAIDFIRKFSNVADSLWFLDPPYYVKGAELYKEHMSGLDHKELSEVIKEELKTSKWLLTYDDCDKIRELYNDCSSTDIALNYSAAVHRKQSEFLVYGGLVIPTFKIINDE